MDSHAMPTLESDAASRRTGRSVATIASCGVLALVTLVLAGLLDGIFHGDSGARLAGMTLLFLAAPALLAATISAFFDLCDAKASTIAATIVIVVLGTNAVDWHEAWRIFDIPPGSWTALVAILFGIAAGFFLVRGGIVFVQSRLSLRLRQTVTTGTVTLAIATLVIGWPSRGRPLLASPPAAAKPNILLVTIDTLRADHLSAYGYDVHRTPNLDQVGLDGIRFDNAFSTASWNHADPSCGSRNRRASRSGFGSPLGSGQTTK